MMCVQIKSNVLSKIAPFIHKHGTFSVIHHLTKKEARTVYEWVAVRWAESHTVYPIDCSIKLFLRPQRSPEMRKYKIRTFWTSWFGYSEHVRGDGYWVFAQCVPILAQPLRAKIRAITEYPNTRTKRQLRSTYTAVSYRTVRRSKRPSPLWLTDTRAQGKCQAINQLPCEGDRVGLPKSHCPTAAYGRCLQDSDQHRLQSRRKWPSKTTSLFFPKALQPTKQRYSTLGRQLLAAYLVFKHFWHYAEDVR